MMLGVSDLDGLAQPSSRTGGQGIHGDDHCWFDLPCQGLDQFGATSTPVLPTTPVCTAATGRHWPKYSGAWVMRWRVAKV